MAKNRKMIGRIRYEKNWHNEGEHYVFEYKYEEEDDWSFECAAPIVSVGEYKDMIHYTALTKIREWNNIGIRDIVWS